MSDLLPFIITGLVTGMIYGLAGTGLVLTFKTSGIFNFGHGAILTAACLLFYWLRVTLEWDWKVGAFVSIAIAGPLLGFLLEMVARNLSRQRTTMKIVGTVGLTVMVPALCLVFYPESKVGLRVERFIPFSNRARYRYRIFDVNIFGDQLVTGGVAIVGVVALYCVFRFSRLGLKMRAAVDDPDLLELLGTSTIRVQRMAWMIGSTFAAVSGILVLPYASLEPFSLVFLATYAFGASAIGGFTSIPLTFIGGLAIGIVQDVIGYVITDHNWTTVDGLTDALPFLVLFVVLLVIPKHRLAPRASAEARPPLSWTGPIELRLGTGVIALAVLLLIPQVVTDKLPFFTFGLCQAILMLSLGLLVKTSGQVSLCHGTFAAISAAAFSQFTVGAGIPWLPALFLAGLVAVPVGALVALPAIRLHGVYLALATYGFGILVTRLFFPQNWMFFSYAGGRKIRTPFGSTDPHTRYYVIMAVLVVCAIVIALISSSRLGRVLRGMSGSPSAVSTLGLSTSVTKVIVFCISAFMAGIAGVMYGVALTTVDGSTTVFQPFNSLVLIAILALAPFREPWYAVFGAFTAVIPAFFSGDRTPNVLNAMFGLFAIMIALRGGHPPMNPKLAAFFGRFGRKRAHEEFEVTRPIRSVASDSPGLEVDDLRVQFGGIRAVDQFSLRAPLGRITGLIGPNGAGKTTTFNAISGINRNVDGDIRFHGRNVSRMSSPARARMGLGRTFQLMELCDELSVRENVALGYEAPKVGSRVVRQIVAPPHERRSMAECTAQSLDLCGISHLAEQQAGALSTGERRLVELARCLSGPFDLLLLDEPSSGLDREETVRFAEVLQHVVESRGCGILLVEHDMSLVMKVCDYIFVLDFGRPIFDGTPAEVASSDVVRAAYLGSESEVLEEFEENLS
ncbi:MAG: ATP-binding cassette domain-containing protein [Actinomycetota bacterium]|nr:ATP-binding cassette domain-containing protein [Actinomycetota bacterium]